MNYTTQAQEVLKLAAESAKLMQHPYIGTEHLLIGLSKIYSGVAGPGAGYEWSQRGRHAEDHE